MDAGLFNLAFFVISISIFKYYFYTSYYVLSSKQLGNVPSARKLTVNQVERYNPDISKEIAPKQVTTIQVIEITQSPVVLENWQQQLLSVRYKGPAIYFTVAHDQNSKG